MLCPLSALNPLGGPERLIDHEDLKPLSAEMASEIISYREVPLSLQDLTFIVESALRLTLPPPEYPDIYDLAPKLPDGISGWAHLASIGIGHFDELGYCPDDSQGRCRSGRDIEIRRLAGYDVYGRFYTVIVEGENGDEIEVEKHSCCRASRDLIDCNSFVIRGCLEYLRVWLDPTLPPRVAFIDSVPFMSLEGELHEILNSRHEIREFSGLVSGFDYGDLPETLEDDQFRFFKARKGSRHLSHAISAGLREEELLPALYADFQCWLSMRPDIWPSPNLESPRMLIFTPFPTSFSRGNPFKTLPTELFLEILHQLSIPAILTLSSASRNLRGLITEPLFMSHIIRTAILSGTEFWVLPVTSLSGEKERAYDVASKWITSTFVMSSTYSTNIENGKGDSVLTTEPPFLSPSFPYLPFLHACYASDSMRSRQRLWKIVKQFDVLWRDYRLNGWQRDDVFAV